MLFRMLRPLAVAVALAIASVVFVSSSASATRESAGSFAMVGRWPVIEFYISVQVDTYLDALDEFFTSQYLATHPAVASRVASSRCAGDFECFRACTLPIESGGDYTTDTGNGYHGGWQFNQGTWDANAAEAGRPDLVGVNPASASPSDQDQIAQHLYGQRGNGPWGGRC